MTIPNGTTIYYGGDKPPFEFVGTTLGWAKYDNEYHYAIRTDTGIVCTRPAKWISEIPSEPETPPETTLPEYVSAYIKHEANCYGSSTSYLVRILQDNLDIWVANAFEAYEGGAR